MKKSILALSMILISNIASAGSALNTAALKTAIDACNKTCDQNGVESFSDAGQCVCSKTHLTPNKEGKANKRMAVLDPVTQKVKVKIVVGAVINVKF